MKTFFVMLLGAVLGFMSPAQARTFNQAELDALLAPVALYPDPLLSQVLMAATYPQDVAEAAAWSRANPHLTGEHAVRAADPYPWDPSVKSLLAFPDVLARMDESPQWTADLGQAFLAYEPYVMDTVQALRRRAHASGHLRSDPYQVVEQHGPTIAVVPVQPHVVYVPYYSPYVVYGTWWWPHYRPVLWRAWRPAPVVVSANFFSGRPDWHRRRVIVRHHHHHRVPEAQRQPIVRSHSLPPAQRIETPRRQEHRAERQEHRVERHKDRKERKEQRRDAHHHRDRRG
jgi:hypothetical protein